MALLNYQSNIIKQIYGDDIINQSNVTISEVENYYKYNSNFNNCIESPDELTIFSSYHGFTDYPLLVQRNDSLSNIDIRKIRFSSDVIESHSSYFKLINEKDIDWENAYLKYSGDYQSGELEKPIEYMQLIAQQRISDGKIELKKIEKDTSNTYLFTRGLSSYINNTYDLYNIIDYLFKRLQALKFLFGVVKEQYENVSIYKSNPA